jgi:branched-chain amino acid transport system permease protein
MTDLAQSLIDALALGGLYALIAVGVTLIYTVMGMMNFAQGEFIMLPAYALYVLAGLPFAVAVGAALATGIGIAVLAERVAFRPVRNADLSAQLVTSLAVATILQNVVSASVDACAQPVAAPAGCSTGPGSGSRCGRRRRTSRWRACSASAPTG